MRFTATPLAGTWAIELDKVEDERGFFARTFCHDQFEARGLCATFVQCNVSFNTRKGTLRGMHLQEAPHAEAKLVRCSRGAIYDVVLDLRAHSPTYRRWVAEELTAENGRMLYVPEGCAHGFLTLLDSTEVFYQMSAAYHPQSARGVRWDDPAFSIRWPMSNPIVSERDAAYPDFNS